MTEPRLALDDAYHWEKTAPDQLWLTQPIGNGEVQTYTWAQAMDQVRRMAAHLKSLDLEPGSHIALISSLPDAERRHDRLHPRSQRVEASVRW
jgi:acyl-coenzyme A synthetase/AMP-(fatty) acid ligase